LGVVVETNTLSGKGTRIIKRREDTFVIQKGVSFLAGEVVLETFSMPNEYLPTRVYSQQIGLDTIRLIRIGWNRRVYCNIRAILPMKAVTLAASEDRKSDAIIAYNLTVIADPIAHGLANIATKIGKIEISEVVPFIPNKSDKSGKSLSEVPGINRAPSYNVPSVV